MGRNTIVWCMVALGTAGGDCRQPGISGAKGRYEFGIENDAGVPQQFGPVADGGAHVLVVADPKPSGGCSSQPAPPAFASAASSDPTVATATRNADGTIEVVTATAGSTDIQLLDDTGAVIDSLTIDIESVTSLAFATPGSVQVLASGTYNVDVTPTGATDEPLIGAASRIEASADGTLANVTVTPTMVSADAVVSFAATDRGNGTVTVTAGSLTETLVVMVVAGTDITSIALGSGGFGPSFNPNDDTEVVWTQAVAAGGPVFGATCAWQVDPSEATLHSHAPADDLGNSPLENSQFVLNGDGPFPATCTIGSAQLEVDLHR